MIKTLDASVNNADVTLKKNEQHFNSNYLEFKTNKIKCKMARLHKINFEWIFLKLFSWMKMHAKAEHLKNMMKMKLK